MILKTSVRNLTYDGDLQDTLEYADEPDPEMRKRDELVRLMALRDKAAKINVYFVRGAYKMSKTVGVSGGLGGLVHIDHYPGNIVATDVFRNSPEWRYGGALAHEVCHALLNLRNEHIAKGRGLMKEGAFMHDPASITYHDFKLRRERAEAAYSGVNSL